KLLIQPARAPAAENVARDNRVSITRFKDRGREPRHVDARQLDAIRHDLAPFGRDLRRLNVDGWDRGAALQRTEVLFDEFPRRRRIEVADNRDARVVGLVIPLEDLARILEFGGLNARMRANYAGVIRMVLRIE